MARWIIDRLLQMVVVLIAATLLGFLLVRLLKGNEVFALLGQLTPVQFHSSDASFDKSSSSAIAGEQGRNYV